MTLTQLIEHLHSILSPETADQPVEICDEVYRYSAPTGEIYSDETGVTIRVASLKQ